jgi:myo-inositol catabolism protein IolC
MELGYDHPLYILPFDHRTSFAKGLFGFSPPLTAEQTATVAASKEVIYDALKSAISKGAPRKAAGILVDEQFGAAILRDATAQDFITCAPAEKSGQDEFAFEYGDRWRDHIAAFAPTFVKVLVRYNPESDEAMNRRQAARLKELSDYCHGSGHRFMFELLVPMTHEQSDRLDGDKRIYDHDLRPSLMIAAIEQLQQAGVEPDVWKVEGLDRRDDCKAIVAAARRDGRRKVSCIVLGRGADEPGVRTWLSTAAAVRGFIGFAIGRTSFWDALVGLRDHALSRDAAVANIATRYTEWIEAFTAERAD